MINGVGMNKTLTGNTQVKYSSWVNLLSHFHPVVPVIAHIYTQWMDISQLSWSKTSGQSSAQELDI